MIVLPTSIDVLGGQQVVSHWGYSPIYEWDNALKSPMNYVVG